jgi:hypothetical protein
MLTHPSPDRAEKSGSDSAPRGFAPEEAERIRTLADLGLEDIEAVAEEDLAP